MNKKLRESILNDKRINLEAAGALLWLLECRCTSTITATELSERILSRRRVFLIMRELEAARYGEIQLDVLRIYPSFWQ